MTGEDPHPQVAPPRELLPLPLVVTLGAVLALALFLFLNAHRLANHDGQLRVSASPPAPAPALVIPPAPLPVITPSPLPSATPAPVPAQPVARAVVIAQPHPVVALRPAEPPRSSGPALVVDLTSGPAAGASGAPDAAEEAARASVIRNRSSVMPQGAVIAAVLETPLNSDRPGLARAVVSKDARSFDGTRVLIPRGSRLIGEFKAEANPSLRRILVTWTRLIRPDGVAMRIASPGADAMGGAGVAGSVNTHFAEKFASAVLQSALMIGVNVASALPVGGNSTVYVGLPGQAQQLGQQLVPSTSRSPTVKVREGAEIAVLVARDLDFSGTPAVR